MSEIGSPPPPSPSAPPPPGGGGFAAVHSGCQSDRVARFVAPAADGVVAVPLDVLTALYHRRSGITHLVAAPVPEILAALAGAPLDRDALLAKLARDHDLIDADPAALDARLDELVEAGLIARG